VHELKETNKMKMKKARDDSNSPISSPIQSLRGSHRILRLGSDEQTCQISGEWV